MTSFFFFLFFFFRGGGGLSFLVRTQKMITQMGHRVAHKSDLNDVTHDLEL